MMVTATLRRVREVGLYPGLLCRLEQSAGDRLHLFAENLIQQLLARPWVSLFDVFGSVCAKEWIVASLAMALNEELRLRMIGRSSGWSRGESRGWCYGRRRAW